ncbi:MAG: LysR family transcriptional regulator [Burkholderiaceae bacterium]
MRFNKLDMNLLVVLDALLATRSVGKAAERLFLSQPATSLALGRLRDYFKDELLVPVGKAMVLTPLAEELAAPVREVLVQVQTITRAQPSFDPGSTRRRFTIESSDYVIAVLLSEVIRRAASLAPLMQFDVRSLSPQTPQNLNGGECELLIAPGFAKVADHPSERLFEDSFSCIVCDRHPAWKKGLSEQAYFDAGHVGVEWGGGRRLTFDTRIVGAVPRERRQDVIAPNFMLVPEFLVGTPRIATLPTRLTKLIESRFPVRVLPCPVAIPSFVELLQWHKYRERDPAILWLRSLIRDVAASLP